MRGSEQRGARIPAEPENSKAFLFVAVDRVSKLAFARIYRQATVLTACAVTVFT
jgi:hypothetical protein